MKNFGSIFLLLLFSATTEGQIFDYEWSNQYYGFAANDSVCFNFDNKFAIDYEDNVYVAGYFDNYLHFGDTILLPGDNEDPCLKINFFIAKYSDTGDFLWAKSTTASEDVYIDDIVTDSRGNVIITGHHQGDFWFDNTLLPAQVAPEYPSDLSLFIIKLDPEGSLLWFKQSTKGAFNWAKIAVDSDDNILIAGNYYRFSIIENDTLNFDQSNHHAFSYLAKFTPTGNLDWVNEVFVWNISGITTDTENNIILHGIYTDHIQYENFSFKSEYAWDRLGYILKIDPEGELIWEKHGFSNPNDLPNGSGDSYISEITVPTSDGFYFAGIIDGESTLNIDSFKLHNPTGLRLYIGFIDNSGNIKKLKLFNDNMGFGPLSTADIIQIDKKILFTTSSGDFIPAPLQGIGGGVFVELDEDLNYRNFEVIKTRGYPYLKKGKSGNLFSLFRFENHAAFIGQDTLYPYFSSDRSSYNIGLSKFKLKTASGFKERFVQKGIEIFPNPASNIIRLNWDKPELAQGTFKILNLSGQIIKSIKTESHIHLKSINISGISPGLYFYTFRFDNSPEAQTGKIIISKN